jgi:hypothetical protein
VCGQPVRFYRTPNDDGRPDFPWHAVDDLQRALGLNRQQREIIAHTMRGDLEAVVRTVETADGLVTIAPHVMADGMIYAMVETGNGSSLGHRDYNHAAAEAFKVLTAHIPFPDLLLRTKAARDRHEMGS